MKKSAKNRIIIWSVVSAVLICMLVVGLAFSSTFVWGKNWVFSIDGEDYSSFSSGNANFAAADVKSVDIKWLAGNVKIENSNGSKIEIEESSYSDISEDKKMRYCLKSDGTLVIKDDINNNFIFGFVNGSHKSLTVKVPDGKKLDSVSLSTTSADVEADELSVDSFSSETASGRVTLNDVNGEKFTGNTASGNISVKGNFSESISTDIVSAECTIESNCKKFDASSISGNVNAKLGSNSTDVAVDSVSGTIDIKLPSDIGGLKAKHSSVSGTFTSEFEGKSNEDTFTFGNESVIVDMSTVSGTMNISKID